LSLSELPGQKQAVVGIPVRGDVSDGEACFRRVRRDRRGDVGEGGVLAARPGLGCVIAWRLRHAAQDFESPAVRILRELGEGIGLVLAQWVIHDVSM
jgi:hypothetical protein